MRRKAIIASPLVVEEGGVKFDTLNAVGPLPNHESISF